MEAGNTVESLRPVEVYEAAQPSEAPADEPEATAVEWPVSSTDQEDTFDVSRAEFDELVDAFLRLHARVDKYNQGAPHKI